MNKKEVGEIKRRLRRDRSNMTAIYGCYVRDNQEIITDFKVSLGLLPENEAEKYMVLFKKTMGGSLGKTLNNIIFSTSQVAKKEARYSILWNLRNSALDDEGTRSAFYKSVIESLQLEHNYLILLGCETYDVPFKNKNDDTDNDSGDESFTYVICSICPVKETKSNLHYVHTESTFHDGGMIQAVNAPIAGFLFPAFDNRSTNLYGALYFNKDTSDSREAFVEAVFGTPPPRPADIEKRSFDALLGSSLGEECNIDVVQALHEQAVYRIQMHAESKVPEPLSVDRKDIQSLLAATGVSEDAVDEFGKSFDESFGSDAEINLQNIIDTRHYVVKTPDVMIKTAPEKAQNIEMRNIGGVNYILIPADDDVEVNGVQIAISHDK